MDNKIFNNINDSNPLLQGGISTHVEQKPEPYRLETPIILDPTTATFQDIRNYALLRQRLAPKTVTNHLKYLRFMELHPCPVDLHNNSPPL